jgi:ribosome-associated protein
VRNAHLLDILANPLVGRNVLESYNNESIFSRIWLKSQTLLQYCSLTYLDNFVNESSSTEPENEDSPSGAAAQRVDPDRSLELARASAKTAAENGGTDVVVLDMSKHTAIFDYFVIATGTSRRQLHAISEEIDNTLEKVLKDKRMNIDGYDDSKWIVLDYGTVVVHLFDEDTRTFYSLEALWGDAEKVDISDLLKKVR